MKKILNYAMLLTLTLALVGLAACSDDDDDDNNSGTNPPVPDAWVGTWLSEGDDVAPILAGAPFNYDQIRVTLGEDNTVLLESHVTDGAWSSLNGTYAVTESANSDIDAIQIVYPAFTQEGIIQVWTASPDSMWLEAVQTVPDYGFVPRTPESGFGTDPVYTDTNIQVYRRVN